MTSRTIPAEGEGISMVALSDSSVINGSSSAITSPALTSNIFARNKNI